MAKSNKKNLLECPQRIKNLCIMAHVDHGKTTLADSLVASNGIITQRQAGKIRYMDSRKDEVERGITMKSSCVTLTYKHDEEIYVINLIDSPGHVDFSSEVSTAVRLCDGTIIVVDVVEGVCAQTKVVLRQAWVENIRPVLVLNKIDRLILEMKLTPLDAYYHITKIFEQVNAFMGELYNTDVMGRTAEEKEKKSKEKEKERKNSEGSSLGSSNMFENWAINEDLDDTDLYFSPESGNVLFASAFDGWGFRLSKFVDMYHKKLNLAKEDLKRALWGDFYISSKGGVKKIVGGAREKGKSPLFVSLILENIYKIYNVIMENKDNNEMEKIAASLDVKLPFTILKTVDHRLKLNFIMSNWLPLSTSVLEMVVSELPSACEVTDDRACKLMCTATQRFDSLPPQTQKLKKAFVECCSDDDRPLIVYVSKMFGVEKSCISHKIGSKVESEAKSQRRPLTMEEIKERRKMILLLKEKDNVANGVQNSDAVEEEHLEEVEEEEEELIAFARVFSGTLRVGQKVFVLGPKHNPNKIIGLTDEESLPHDVLDSLEYIHYSEVKDIYLLMGRHLERVNNAPAGSIVGIGGLEGIFKSATLSSTPFCTPFTELTLQASPILRVAVETVDPRDLPKLRKGLNILNQSDPCVQVKFKESGEYLLITAGEVHLQKCIQDLEERYARVSLTVSPPIVPFRETIIPPPTFDRLNEAYIRRKHIRWEEENSHIIQMIYRSHRKIVSSVNNSNINNNCNGINDLNSDLEKYEPYEELSSEALRVINSFKNDLKNVLEESGEMWKEAFNQIWSFGPHYCGCNILLNRIESYKRPSFWEGISSDFESPLLTYDTNFVTGFQIASSVGPLCEEPMMGVCFIVEDWEVNTSSNSSVSDTMGQIISMVKDSLRKSFENSHQRLTSGEAIPQLVFSHWEILPIDPFWEPQTTEEVTHWGDKADSENIARNYINDVRRRKGLPTDDKIVASAEKQRTLSKNK
ncbi:Elongation factor-like GTPase 1 [Armadillidium nasatum]|uniref:Elongation factor-like GTPase 1 n=1 Tax=Armadillidium nasatum TaxID=96803 RepID=A0A5N5TB80_9CRUS|nr:Elongation factor-like GTPase 1 [Armadillidium nasatum]